MKNAKVLIAICVFIGVGTCAIPFQRTHLINDPERNDFQDGKDHESKAKWLFEILYRSTELLKNASCSSHMKFYLQELSKITTWALEMFDASAKLPSGLLDGNLRHLGHFDECINIKVESIQTNRESDEKLIVNNKIDKFYGQYCLVTVNFDLNQTAFPEESSAEKSLLKNINSALDKMMLERRQLEDRKKERVSMDHMPVIPIFSLSQWAICIPSTCSNKEMEIYLQHIANSILSAVMPQTSYLFNLTLQIDNEACVSHSVSDSHVMEPRAGSNSFLWFMSFLVGILIVGTCCDLLAPSDSHEGKTSSANLLKLPGRRILVAFSVPANLKKIITAGSTMSRSSTTNLDCLDGIRFLSTVWVILTHKVLILTREPFLNKAHLKESLASLFWMPLTANMMSVDSFLLLGGLLRGYNYANDLDQGKSNQISSIIQRYLRLTPALAVMIWFYATTLDHIYYGPEWNSYVKSASLDCQESWLLNLLYINNYFGFPRLCILQSWYLSADMQLFIISPILLYPLWSTYNHRTGTQKYLGSIPLISALIACMALQFGITYYGGYPALYRVGSEDHILLRYTQYIHMATHTRMGPYILGLLMGFMLNKLRGKNVAISKLTVASGWMLSFTLIFYVLYGPYSTLQLGTPYRPLSDSIYASTHRAAWGIALCWLVFACYKGYGGPINKILSAKIFKQLSSISYCMFLIHFAVLLTNMGSIRTNDYKDQYKLVRDFIADVVVTMVLSTALYIFIEAPFSAITTMIFKKGQETKKKQHMVHGIPEKPKHQ